MGRVWRRHPVRQNRVVRALVVLHPSIYCVHTTVRGKTQHLLWHHIPPVILLGGNAPPPMPNTRGSNCICFIVSSVSPCRFRYRRSIPTQPAGPSPRYCSARGSPTSPISSPAVRLIRYCW